MKKLVLGGLSAVALAFSMNAMAADFVAGKDYTVIANPGKTSAPAGQLEVREFFWYGCPHCFKLEPHMQTWLKQIPKDVYFLRTPAAMNKVWEQGARGYYVSEALGVRKKTHIPLFHAIHEGGQQIFDQASQAKFFARYGVPEQKFNSMFNSFPITAKIAESNKLAQQYQLTGVPAVVVNGKYVVQGEDAKVTQVVDYLLEKERKAK
ncbi:thiol:disulfide interchange protein DsbA/DsbL [Acinetobacter sp. C32I]|uniref:thiol:disulfide interchange protein DsbA/DsbL n=1 Tax=Acinetobacter TaxID=469 RepID=UPI0020375354|nr:thiol:disulfide interchange protein DsbA/DsbL [Acinetobacter sp. C32I]USA52701.1 thiol:disulfide interchange protein DsbA/DsbL [Acinetobacter sp. C32I]